MKSLIESILDNDYDMQADNAAQQAIDKVKQAILFNGYSRLIRDIDDQYGHTETLKQYYVAVLEKLKKEDFSILIDKAYDIPLPKYIDAAIRNIKRAKYFSHYDYENIIAPLFQEAFSLWSFVIKNNDPKGKEKIVQTAERIAKELKIKIIS